MICFGRIGLAILLLGACFTAVSGQYLCVRHLDRGNVLPTQSINDVDNDPSGVLWLATNTGLFHYDGMQCERIPLYSLLDSHYLYQVNRVMTDQHGVTYLAFLNNGLGVLEKGLPLRHYKKNRKDDSGLPNNSIDYLLDLGENVLLIFEQNGFALFHKKSGRFTHLLPSSYFPHADTIARIDLLYKAVSDPEHPGDAWLSGAMGLFHWDHRRRQLFHYPLAPGISSLAPARAIYLHRDQKLYLGGFGKGPASLNDSTAASSSSFTPDAPRIFTPIISPRAFNVT